MMSRGIKLKAILALPLCLQLLVIPTTGATDSPAVNRRAAGVNLDPAQASAYGYEQAQAATTVAASVYQMSPSAMDEAAGNTILDEPEGTLIPTCAGDQALDVTTTITDIEVETVTVGGDQTSSATATLLVGSEPVETQAPTQIATGGGNPIATGGGNPIATGGGNPIATGGGNQAEVSNPGVLEIVQTITATVTVTDTRTTLFVDNSANGPTNVLEVVETLTSTIFVNPGGQVPDQSAQPQPSGVGGGANVGPCDCQCLCPVGSMPTVISNNQPNNQVQPTIIMAPGDTEPKPTIVLSPDQNGQEGSTVVLEPGNTSAVGGGSPIATDGLPSVSTGIAGGFPSGFETISNPTATDQALPSGFTTIADPKGGVPLAPGASPVSSAVGGGNNAVSSTLEIASTVTSMTTEIPTPSTTSTTTTSTTSSTTSSTTTSTTSTPSSTTVTPVEVASTAAPEPTPSPATLDGGQGTLIIPIGDPKTVTTSTSSIDPGFGGGSVNPFQPIVTGGLSGVLTVPFGP
ncbi:hypothetical protein TWF694_008559 [Orbilia ellipsospora]|uniref:Uncharacterized protein n=1 Tax=Orbilia ellipsospora TaxID=2528407 RepID=A0AAV9XGF8_9PEZI